MWDDHNDLGAFLVRKTSTKIMTVPLLVYKIMLLEHKGKDIYWMLERVS